MLDGLFILLVLSVVMAVASFLAGALPLSMSLSQSQLRLLSAIGMGVLVGTSLVVIIPEGIEAVYASSIPIHTNGARAPTLTPRTFDNPTFYEAASALPGLVIPDDISIFERRADTDPIADTVHPPPGPVVPESSNLEDFPTIHNDDTPISSSSASTTHPSSSTNHTAERSSPFYIGLSLITGFILMFLIDKLPRHASSTLQSPPPRHISLNNLSDTSPTDPISSDSFLHSLAPSPKQTRNFATTTGLVIHAAADGIAMGASATSSNTELGFIIFLAIMLHKAPAAFGLTSVLLKQGLSKRAARGHLIIFSLAAPIGALTTWLLVNIAGGAGMEGEKGQWWTGMLLLFSAGTFLYVAMHAMQDDAAQHDNSSSSPNGFGEGGGGGGLPRKGTKPVLRDTLASVVGMLIPLVTQVGHHH
ncbi:hypothetical protein VC83_05996 [Pseudogymnoascus destructans]|uniref:Uncharacterized protein n=2 Tax=Pseudogymnoascus destructans TaxID=655981 RepID=L8G6Y4_PSED2|nr:uncharacterized protein VC83_05996 [Pseudogymnoascus destructans]ELR09000.1 hypothetical protein GMDG_00618 [Pseudogymnoascus destructans 20631-21]OAF57138.1 hypothetical protein VC83_05996 [Pseudogymnoascus destructans]